MTPLDFLKHFDAHGVHNLVAIKPDAGGGEGPIGVTIQPGDWPAAQRFIERFDGQRNLYFSVNEPKPDAPDDKLRKEHIARIRAIPADVDPKGGDLDEARADIVKRARAALATLAPAYAIDSGGGYQFYWKLADKLDAETYRKQAEDQARGLARLLEGDGVGNIDRIMRLPGTVNLPDAKKRARGRIERRSVVLDARDDTTTLDALRAAYKPIERDDGEDSDEAVQAVQRALDMGYVKGFASYADLPEDLRARFEAYLSRDEHAAGIWSGAIAPRDTSGSGWRFELAGLLKRAGGFEPHEFGALAWVWDRCDPAKLTARVVARDWVRADAAPDPAHFIEDVANLPALRDVDPFAAQAEREAADIAGHAAKFVFEPFAEVAAAEVTSNPPLIKGLLDQGAMSVLYGDSNAGKTFVALDMAAHIGAGLDYAGMRTARGLVVYVAAEGGRGIRKRFKALREKFPGDVDVVLLACPVDLRRPDADLAPLVAAIRGLEQPVALIVLDTLSRVMAGGDENSSVDMGALVRHFDLLRAGVAGCHLMIVHHTGKDKARGARGHSLLRAATDTEIEVADRVVTVTKQRDMDGEWSRGFDLDVHVLGEDGDGDVVTSCTVRLLGAGERARAVTPDSARAVLAAMREAWENGEPWSLAPQAATERRAVRRMVEDWGFDAREADGLLAAWQQTGLIETRMLSARDKRKGLFVVGNLGQDVRRDDIFG